MSWPAGNALRRSLVAGLVSAVVWAVSASAQAPATAALLQHAEALQFRLAAWRNTVKGMTFNESLPPGLSLDTKQSNCLFWIKATDDQIALLKRKLTPAMEVGLLSHLTLLDNVLSNLEHALELAHVTPPLADQAGVEELAQEKRLKSLREELHEFYNELSAETFHQLRADTQGPQAEAGPASHGPGEISGHVYRADTGNPLANTVVTLESPASPQNDKVQRTGEDGSYEFSGLAPGIYWAIAYRNGFVGSVYGIGKSQNASKGLIPVAPGQKRENIDFRLSPSPDIITLSGKALAKALPSAKAAFTYGPGSFSPDARQFAFAVAGVRPQLVCVDSLSSHSLKCMPGPAVQRLHRNVKPGRVLRPLCTGCVSGPGTVRFPAKYTFNYPAWAGPEGHPARAWPRAPIETINCLAWVGDKLYAEADYNGGDLGFIFQLTHGSTAPFSAVAQAFRQEHNEAGGAGVMHFVAGDNHFTVTAWNGQLAMSNPDGEDPYVIATGDKEMYTFVFDPKRSLVFYPVPGRFNGSIVSFNLNTRRYQTTPLPYSEGLKLLDVKEEQTGTLAAYTVDGPCLPPALANGENPWILPGHPSPVSQPPSMCLARIPNPGSL